MRDSILYSGLQTFFKALFSVSGICLGIIPAILLYSFLFSFSESEPESDFEITLLPNAKNQRKSLSSNLPVILNIDIKGVVGVDGLTQDVIRNLLVESREGSLKDDRVKAIFLTIETPGGTVIDADGIYRALKSYKEQYKVPIYAYVDGMCASGGMYIASAADKIYASDTSLVGSVGVLSPSFLNLTDLIEKIGVQALTLTAGKGKDQLNPLRKWVPGEQDAMQGIIISYYNTFVDIVTASRPALDKQKLIEEYGAHVFTAPQAAEYGYIDRSGVSRNEALTLLLEELKIKNDSYRVISLSSKSWWTSLFTGESALFTGKIKHEIKWQGEMHPALSGKFLYLYRG